MSALHHAVVIIRRDRAIAAVASTWIASVLVLLIMHPFAEARWGEAGPWAIEREDGMLSVFGWALWLWCAVLATWLAVGERSWSLLAWPLVLLLLLVDDAMTLHEQWAGRLARAVPALAGFAELVVLGAIGCTCLLVILVARARAQARIRGVHTGLLVLLAITAAFGVGADAVQGAAVAGSAFHAVVTVVEQLGETLGLVAVASALLAWIGHGATPSVRAIVG